MGNTIRRMRAREGGFTLVELLVVIAILGVLAGIAVFTLSGSTDKAEGVACQANARTVESAAAAYHADTGDWPATMGALVPDYLRSAPDDVSYSSTDGSASCTTTATT
jgi:prepilin-type N-terminal cleavage/methylation domain-containing protein